MDAAKTFLKNRLYQQVRQGSCFCVCESVYKYYYTGKDLVCLVLHAASRIY